MGTLQEKNCFYLLSASGLIEKKFRHQFTIAFT